MNKNGAPVAAAVTNLDLHDIARLARTYGVRAFYVITPLEDQRKLTRRIIHHWVEGGGADYNPARREALSLVRVKQTYGEMIEEITRRENSAPKTVVTSARETTDGLSFARLREMLLQGRPYLLNFGTAWGLSEEFIAAADYRLEPIFGGTNYNHLSVRSAASIVVDRLLGGSSDRYQHEQQHIDNIEQREL